MDMDSSLNYTLAIQRELNSRNELRSCPGRGFKVLKISHWREVHF
jgi:hypothetical protein